jgi:ribonuclease BN (tRNA processing enzyme)
LICELAHFEPQTLFDFLASRQVSRLILTHASAEIAGKIETVLAAARKSLPDTEVLYATDKLKVPLRRAR